MKLSEFEFDLENFDRNIHHSVMEESQTNLIDLKGLLNQNISSNDIEEIKQSNSITFRVTNEYFVNVSRIPSRVISVSNEKVIVECLIDSENKIFQTREFPKYIFSHIDGLKPNHYFFLKLSYKPGVVRTEILNISTFNKEPFEEKDDLEEFSKRGYKPWSKK